jgi:hypothetical protein
MSDVEMSGPMLRASTALYDLYDSLVVLKDLCRTQFERSLGLTPSPVSTMHLLNHEIATISASVEDFVTSFCLLDHIPISAPPIIMTIPVRLVPSLHPVTCIGVHFWLHNSAAFKIKYLIFRIPQIRKYSIKFQLL